MIAVIDESSPEGPGGIYYVVSAAVLLDADVVGTALGALFDAQRTRPFHWTREGPEARARVVELLCTSGVVAHVTVHHPVGRRRQEQARTAALEELVPLIAAEGATELVIESRRPKDDERDRSTILDVARALDLVLTYRWEAKEERLLWLADAVCGAVKEYLLGEDAAPYELLHASGVLSEIRYRHAP